MTLEAGGAGRSSATLAVTEAGLYRVGDGERTALAAAGPPNPLEFRDVRSTGALLRPLVEASNGAILALAESGLPSLRKVAPGRDSHGRDWLGLRATDSYLVTGVSQVPLLPALLVLLLAMTAMVLGWFREGR